MTNAFTPAQPGDTPGQVEPDDSRPKPIDAADPLDEAIEAAVKAFIASRRSAGTMDYFRTSYTAEAVEDAVRAAAPIIAAPIQAERDALAQLLEATTTAGEALRARLATAERDALTRAADFVEEFFGKPTGVFVAKALRERAKEADGE